MQIIANNVRNIVCQTNYETFRRAEILLLRIADKLKKKKKINITCNTFFKEI